MCGKTGVWFVGERDTQEGKGWGEDEATWTRTCSFFF
jgi:hypothetical protein